MANLNLGVVTAYGYAKDNGYTGTEEQFAELMASYATVAEQAAQSATDAAGAKTDAESARDAAVEAKNLAVSAKEDAQSARDTATGAAGTATSKASEAAGYAGTASTKATAAANSATEASGYAGTATTKAGQAADSATAANTSKEAAADSAEDSEAWAVGQVNGTDVASSAAQYHNNSKYYSQQAADSATAAAASAASLTIDSATSTSSTNALQNKVITGELNDLKNDLNDLIYNQIDDLSLLLSGIAYHQNMFNPDRATVGGYYYDNGSVLSQADGVYSEDFIPVSTGTYYFYKNDDDATLLIATYNENRQFISRINAGYNTSGSFEIASTVKFIRVSLSHGLSEYESLTISEKSVNAFNPYEYGLKDNAVKTNSLTDKCVTRDKIADYTLATTAQYHELNLNDSRVSRQEGYIDNAGALVTSVSYYSYIIPIFSDCYCYFDSESTYYSICVYSGLPVGTSTFLPPRLRFNNSDEDTAPKVNSKLHLNAGQYIAITFLTDGIGGFYINDPAYYSELLETVHLSNGAITSLKKSIGIGNYALCHGNGNNVGVYLFFKTAYGFLRYSFDHAYNQSINADNWRINYLHAVDDELRPIASLTTSGEWECALRLDNRPDYSGGIMHGDEVTTELIFIFDGKPYSYNDLSIIGELNFDNLKILEVSNLYDPLDNITIIAKHEREYTFEKGKVTIKQIITWNVNDTLSACYLAMLPVSKAYTDMFYTDLNFTPIVSAENYGTYPNVKKATQYSDDKGFICSLEIKKYPTGYQGGDNLNLRDNGSDYNKMYYTICSDGTITAGTKWYSESVYEFCVGESIASE